MDSFDVDEGWCLENDDIAEDNDKLQIISDKTSRSAKEKTVGSFKHTPGEDVDPTAAIKVHTCESVGTSVDPSEFNLHCAACFEQMDDTSSRVEKEESASSDRSGLDRTSIVHVAHALFSDVEFEGSDKTNVDDAIGHSSIKRQTKRNDRSEGWHSKEPGTLVDKYDPWNRNSAPERKPSVRFSEEVLVGTYSNRESVISEPTAPVPAYGDGISSIGSRGVNDPGQSPNYERSITFRDPENVALSTHDSTGHRKYAVTSTEKATLRRNDSVGKNLSPTDILKKRQKQVADKIIRSVYAKPSTSGEFRKTKLVSHKIDYKDIPSVSTTNSENVHRGFSVDLEGDRSLDRPSSEEIISTQSCRHNTPDSHHLIPAPIQDCSGEHVSIVNKGRCTENGSDEQETPVQSTTIKHKNLLDRQNSRQTLLIKKLSMNEEAENISEDLTLKSEGDGQSKDKLYMSREVSNNTTQPNREEENYQGPQTFSFTSPSKVQQKIADIENNENTSPGISSFSYSSPSKLLRKHTDRQTNEQNGPGYGAISYTSPSELLFKTEQSNPQEGGVDEISRCSESSLVKQRENISSAHNDEKPGSWFFVKESLSQLGRKSFDSQTSVTSCDGAQKKQNKSYENNVNSLLDFNVAIEEVSDIADSLCNESQISQNEGGYVKDVHDDERSTDTMVESGDIQTALAYMNSLLIDFLDMLNDKRRRNAQITLDDYRELDVIERTIETIISKILKSSDYFEGNFEPDASPEACLDKSSEEKKRLASNLKAHLALLAEAKHKMRKNLAARSAHTVTEKLYITPKAGSSKSIDNVPQRSSIHSDKGAGTEQRQPSVNEVYSAIDDLKTESSVESNVGSAKKISSGYLGDVSSDSIYESNTYIHGWKFSNKFLRETSFINEIRNDVDFFGSEVAPSPSISLNNDLWSVESVCGSDLESVQGRHTVQCDCVECRKKWISWNKSFERDTEASIDDTDIESGIMWTSADSSSSTLMPSRLRDSPLPSNLALTLNPSYANLSDEEAEVDNEYDNAEDSAEGSTGSTQQQDVDSMAVSDPSVNSNVTLEEYSPRKISLVTSLTFPEDTSSVRVELGPSRFMLTKDEGLVPQRVEFDVQTTPASDIETLTIQEGSPDRKLFGSSQNLDRRGDLAKRKQAGRSMTPDSKYMMDKEVVETQNRRLQTEISTLQTENKLLKEKYNRSQGRISELEEQLSETQDDVNTLQESLNREVSSLSVRTRQEIDRGRDDLQARVLSLTKENEALKSEVSSLEKHLESSNRTVDMVRHNTEKTRTLEAHKAEISSLKEELGRVKALLEQSERHLREEEERHTAVGMQVVKLTELKNALQQQQDSGSEGTVGDKQLKSLEKRLQVTEERLHQERADRANNLSAVEDKLLTENARLQAAEKDLSRQLHREKEKNRNHDHRVKQLREENEKLRLAVPFDDAKLLEDKNNYDIPYSSHSNQRADTLKHISDDMNYILSQIEKQDGLQGKGDQEEMIRTLWNKRELAYQQLREYEVNFQELHLNDNNIMDGLKNLRDTYGQAESKLRAMEEQVEDAQVQMATLEATYKEQLNILVHERHDAFARLKTAGDILEAVRAENELLRQNVQVVHSADGERVSSGGSLESLQMEVVNLESKLAQLTRTNERLDGELSTTKTQVDARNKTLQDVQSELDLAYNRLKGQDGDDRKQQKIDKLSTELSGVQVELKMLTDKYNNTVSEKSRLEAEITELRQRADVQKVKQQKTGHTEGKVLEQLKDELAERESRLTSVTKQLENVETELQRHQQDLYIEQMHNAELESEVESLRHTVDQRALMFESLSGTEREQLAQYQILKETLDNVNQELAQKHAQIISLDVNLSSQKDRTAELEGEVERLRIVKGDHNVDFTEAEQSSVHQLRISELERERSQLKQELVQAYNAIKAAEEQYRTLQSESAQLEQELVKEKTVILQITAEKGEVEQHLEELAEEHDSLIQEKNQAEEDLIRLETKLQEILQKYETEARKQHADFTREYPNLPPEAKKLVSELDSLRLIVDGKNREIGMLEDKINRQQIDIEFLNRKVELVHNDSISNREDVARMISELTLKMKESVSTREVNQFLVGERTKLQNEKSHLEVELEQERQNNDQRKKEIADVLRKVHGTESRQKSVEKESKDKAELIASLETDLHSKQQKYSTVESELSQLKSRLEQQNRDLQHYTEINATMEKQLQAEKASLLEERSALSKLREEFTRVSHDYELLQHEHAVLCDKHEAGVQTIENLRRDLSTREEENSKLHEELHTAQIDLESQKGQLFITKDTVQKLSQDKGSIYQDYEGMCRTVTEKERQLSELRERSEEQVNHVQVLHRQEKVHLEQDKLSAERDRDAYKRELESVREQLEQKEIQLNTFGKTLQELESITRQKNVLEAKLQQLESSTGDSKTLLAGQRKELMALNEALAKQQDRSTRIEAENHTLKADLKSQKEALNRDSKELSITIKELKSQHENERQYLNDNLAQTQTQLRKVETSLVSASNERDTLAAHKRMVEISLEELQSKLADESTGRRLAEQSVGTLRLQLEDMRNDKNTCEARYVEMKNQLSRAEEKLKSDQVRQHKLSGKVQELTAVTHTTESTAKAKAEQIDTLQKEISRLKQMIESQKQSMMGKLKKASLEFQQQLDIVQEEREKLVLQVQKLSSDLEACREQLTLKNRDTLKLQEDNLVLEDRVRESKAKHKQAEETLRAENEKLSAMANRFLEQDEELKRLRNFLAKKAEDSGEADKSMWQEMNRVIQDLSRQMHDHLDAQKSEGKDAPTHHQVVLRYKKQLSEVQGELNTEKSLHQITKTSLQALEEDSQRLRHQLHAMRRREPVSGEKKYKSRTEAINAIIARSQTQAQALLASGGYLDNLNSPRVPHSARPGYPGSPQRPESPDNSYSEDLSIASLPPLHYGMQK